MAILDFLKNKKFTFKNCYGIKKSMSAIDIYNSVMEKSKKSDFNWIAPASELVKLCKNSNFPWEYAVGIEIAILNCFANIEERVNLGGDKFIDNSEDELAVQYCYDELGRLMNTTDDQKLKKTLNSVRMRYLKVMINSAVNTTIRGFFLRKAHKKLKEEVVEKNFVKYSNLENINILDMYKEISKETYTMFMEAYKNGVFEEEEEEKKFSIVKAFEDTDGPIF